MQADEMRFWGESPAGRVVAKAVEVEYGSSFRPFGMAAHALAALHAAGYRIIPPDDHEEDTDGK